MKLATQSVLAVPEVCMKLARIPNFKIRQLGVFEKNAFLYVAMAKKPLSRNRYHFYRPNYPPKCRKTHLRNHFWPLESVFLAIATYKNAFFSKAHNSRSLKFRILSLLIHIYGTARTDCVANFVELGHEETCSDLF